MDMKLSRFKKALDLVFYMFINGLGHMAPNSVKFVFVKNMKLMCILSSRFHMDCRVQTLEHPDFRLLGMCNILR